MPLFQQTTRPVRVQRLLCVQSTLPVMRSLPLIDGVLRLLVCVGVA